MWTLAASPGPMWAHLLRQAALNPHNRVTDDAKSGLTGKGPSAGCVMRHFSASQFPAIGWAVAILKTSCEDVLLTQVEMRRRNDQTLQRPNVTMCSQKVPCEALWSLAAVDVFLVCFSYLFYCFGHFFPLTGVQCTHQDKKGRWRWGEGHFGGLPLKHCQ